MSGIRSVWVLTLALVAPAQELLWEREGEPERSQFFGWPIPFGDIDQDGFEDWLTLVNAYQDFGNWRYAEPQLWTLSGKDGRTLRVRREYATQMPFGFLCAAGDMDRDGIGDYAVTIRDVRNPRISNIVEVRAGRDDSLIWSHSTGQRDAFGGHLLGGRDLNRDGEPDLIVTDGSWQPPGAPWRQGMVYAFSSRGQELWRITGNNQMGIAIYGANSSSLGWVGDLDRDGTDDFVVGGVDDVLRRGMAVVLSGKDGSILVRGLSSRPSETIGQTVDGCGDVDRDGVPDFVAGSDPGGLGQVGVVQLFSGRTGQTIREWSDLLRGSSLRSGGHDFDLDGIPDVVMTVDGIILSQNPFSAGVVHVSSGRDGGVLHEVRPCSVTHGCRVTYIGDSLAVAGPQPGSPFPLFAVGEPEYGSYCVPRWQQCEYQGRVRVFRGAPAGARHVASACPGQLGRPPRMGIRDLKGAAVRLHLFDAPLGAPAVLALGLGPADRFGPFGCDLGFSPVVLVPATAGDGGLDRGYAFVDLPIPLAVPGRERFALLGQWFVLAGSGASAGGASDTLRWLHR